MHSVTLHAKILAVFIFNLFQRNEKALTVITFLLAAEYYLLTHQRNTYGIYLPSRKTSPKRTVQHKLLNCRDRGHAQLPKTSTASALIYDGLLNFNNKFMKRGELSTTLTSIDTFYELINLQHFPKFHNSR